MACLKKYILTLSILIISHYPSLYAQNLGSPEKERIVTEINTLFEKSVEAAEKLDVTGLTESVDDTLNAGFIDNSIYFNSFDILIAGFRQTIKGLQSQKITIVNKKITLLSEDAVLVTASGKASALTTEGRERYGNFGWSLIYKKMNGHWRIIHTHMSNSR